MENRKETRKKKNIRVQLKDEDGLYPAMVTSISKEGMSVKTGHTFPAYKVIDVLAKIDSQVLPIKGSVRWVNELPGSSEDESYEIGLLLHQPPAEYTRHFE